MSESNPPICQTISEQDDGIRLDRWFKRHHAGLPHAMLEKMLRKGDVRLDGKKAKTSDRIAIGQQLVYPSLSSVAMQPKMRKTISPIDAAMMQKQVLYKDANVIVLNKPFGLAVQGGTKITKSVDDLLDALTFDAPERPKLVHRLDRDTTGCLVLARNTKAASVLAKAFAGKEIEKTYWALVHNVPIPPQGMVDYKLVKAVYGASSHERVAVDEEDGKYAKTDYRVLEFLARRFALMELRPHTGRTHQLRVHMMAVGCPIVGDNKYGGETVAAKHLGVQNMLHLHARRVVLPAMGGIRAIDVTAPLPPHMQQSFEALGIERK
jgi:23S rRNA pseudouridine955/2504/2580 synthase